jgi:hypothetical protein
MVKSEMSAENGVAQRISGQHCVDASHIQPRVTGEDDGGRQPAAALQLPGEFRARKSKQIQ